MNSKHAKEQEEIIRKLIGDLKDEDPENCYAAACSLAMIIREAISAVPF